MLWTGIGIGNQEAAPGSGVRRGSQAFDEQVRNVQNPSKQFRFPVLHFSDSRQSVFHLIIFLNKF